jgi:hypothetical protein
MSLLHALPHETLSLGEVQLLLIGLRIAVRPLLPSRSGA